MKTDMVQQYYKCPITGVEMNFRKDAEYGWVVCFPKSSIDEALDYEGAIPWPYLSEKEQKEVDNNYKELYKMLGKEEE